MTSLTLAAPKCQITWPVRVCAFVFVGNPAQFGGIFMGTSPPFGRIAPKSFRKGEMFLEKYSGLAKKV